MVVSVRLEAIRKGSSEELRGGVTERPDITLLLDDLTTLGKNEVTKIADTGLKRKTLQLRLETGNVLRIVRVATGRVSVNGKLAGSPTLLNEGDVISLHASERAYDYKVVVAEGGEPPPPPVGAALAHAHVNEPQPTTTTANASANLQHIAEEFTCAVCLDLQVQATTLVPCGHSFCKACVGPGVCSICSSTIATTVTCRAVDNVISTLVSAGQVFSNDDAQIYRERMKDVAGAGGSRSTPLRGAAANKKNSHKKRRKALIAQVSSGGGSVGASAADAICIID